MADAPIDAPIPVCESIEYHDSCEYEGVSCEGVSCAMTLLESQVLLSRLQPAETWLEAGGNRREVSLHLRG